MLLTGFRWDSSDPKRNPLPIVIDSPRNSPGRPNRFSDSDMAIIRSLEPSINTISSRINKLKEKLSITDKQIQKTQSEFQRLYQKSGTNADSLNVLMMDVKSSLESTTNSKQILDKTNEKLVKTLEISKKNCNELNLQTKSIYEKLIYLQKSINHDEMINLNIENKEIIKHLNYDLLTFLNLINNKLNLINKNIDFNILLMIKNLNNFFNNSIYKKNDNYLKNFKEIELIIKSQKLEIIDFIKKKINDENLLKNDINDLIKNEFQLLINGNGNSIVKKQEISNLNETNLEEITSLNNLILKSLNINDDKDEDLNKKIDKNLNTLLSSITEIKTNYIENSNSESNSISNRKLKTIELYQNLNKNYEIPILKNHDFIEFLNSQLITIKNSLNIKENDNNDNEKKLIDEIQSLITEKSSIISKSIQKSNIENSNLKKDNDKQFEILENHILNIQKSLDTKNSSISINDKKLNDQIQEISNTFQSLSTSISKNENKSSLKKSSELYPIILSHLETFQKQLIDYYKDEPSIYIPELFHHVDDIINTKIKETKQIHDNSNIILKNDLKDWFITIDKKFEDTIVNLKQNNNDSSFLKLISTIFENLKDLKQIINKLSTHENDNKKSIKIENENENETIRLKTTFIENLRELQKIESLKSQIKKEESINHNQKQQIQQLQSQLNLKKQKEKQQEEFLKLQTEINNLKNSNKQILKNTSKINNSFNEHSKELSIINSKYNLFQEKLNNSILNNYNQHLNSSSISLLQKDDESLTRKKVIDLFKSKSKSNLNNNTTLIQLPIQNIKNLNKNDDEFSINDSALSIPRERRRCASSFILQS